MPVVEVRPWAAQAGHPHRYRVACLEFATNISFGELAGYESGELKSGRGAKEEILLSREQGRARGNADRVYRGPGYVGAGWREIECRHEAAGYRLCVSGVGGFHVCGNGQGIYQDSEDPGVSPAHVRETILGPALILALAIGGVWCLHGSAVRVRGRTVVFLGESGMGKSTLAAWLAGEGVDGSWRRVADDILPVTWQEGRLEALPRFPQLKLPPDAQPALSLPERLPLDAVYVLSRPAGGEQVAVHPLDTQEAALKLVRHTAASRLFAPDLLVRHLDFCVQAAATVPVRRLEYPLTIGALPGVREAILRDLGAAESAPRRS